MVDRAIPIHRIKRILEIDEHVPRMNKKALATLAKSLKIFLQEYAKDIHKHIVNTGSSYPVKPKHIVNVSFDPRFIKYDFLTHARRIIEVHDEQLEPINKMLKRDESVAGESCAGESREWNRERREESQRQESGGGSRLNVKCNINTSKGSGSVKTRAKRSAKSVKEGSSKRAKQSILTYFAAG